MVELFDYMSLSYSCPRVPCFGINFRRGSSVFEEVCHNEGLLAFFFEHENIPLQYKTFLINSGFVKKITNHRSIICYHIPQSEKIVTKYYKCNRHSYEISKLLCDIARASYFYMYTVIDMNIRMEETCGIRDLLPKSIEPEFPDIQGYRSYDDIPLVNKHNVTDPRISSLKVLVLTEQIRVKLNGQTRLFLTQDMVDACRAVNMHKIPIAWNLNRVNSYTIS